MKRDHKFTDGSKLEAFRLPLWLSEQARETARLEDLTFSQLMRRAIRKELGVSSAADPETVTGTD